MTGHDDMIGERKREVKELSCRLAKEYKTIELSETPPRQRQLAQTRELISRFGLEEPEDIARAMRISVDRAKKLKRYIAK